MFLFFLFNDTATTEIYTYLHTLSLHDALPISPPTIVINGPPFRQGSSRPDHDRPPFGLPQDRHQARLRAAMHGPGRARRSRAAGGGDRVYRFRRRELVVRNAVLGVGRA